MPRPLLPPFFFFIKTFLLLSLFIPTYFASDDAEAYTACAPFSCGNFSDISYPFWSSNQPNYCGHPKFKLDCQQDNLTIDIMSQKFHIIDIDQTTQVLKIARLDLWVDPCTKDYTDVSLDFPFFDYTTNDDNITLLYDCDPPSYAFTVNFNLTLTLTCPMDVFRYLVLTPNLADFVDLGCKNSTTFPALKGVIQSSIKDGDGAWEHVLDEGFEVGWSGVNRDQCDSCIQSGGRCGHNASFICICPNQKTYDEICGKSPAWSPLTAPPPILPVLPPTLPKYSDQSPRAARRKWKPILGIGVGAFALIVIAMIFALYFIRRRKRNTYAKSYLQSESLSSGPSLKDPENSLSFALEVHVFTYAELEEATNNFDPARELGEGGFGTVYYGQLRDGRRVAVKRLYENSYRRVEQFMNEVKILTRLRHPNLVSLFGCTSRHSHELLLVYEYIPNGTVADHLHGERAKPAALPWHIRMNIAIQTASALKYLHAEDIIHRDVKTNNILLDSHFCVKVADFGLSRLFPDNVTHVSTVPQGTPGYIDPEYHECYQLTSKSDVYSFGVVLIELTSSLPAVDITRHRHEINLASMAINKIHNQALHELVDPALGFDSDYKVRKMITAVAELAFLCLQSSKDMRPSMEEVLDTLMDIQSDGKQKSQPEVMDMSADDVVLLKDDPPPASPDSNVVSKSTTPNASG